MIDAGSGGSERTVAAYRAAHLSNDGGYSARTHSFMREDVVLHMYEIALLLRTAFVALGWSEPDLARKRVLEVGSAWGFRLNQLLGFPFDPGHLCGIDLIPEYVEAARRLNPAIRFETMSATALEFEPRAFDLSLAVMALSAMPDDDVVSAALAEMCRVSREALLLIDNFEPAFTDARRDVVYFRGVDPSHVERLRSRADVASVTRIGSFWTTSRAAWRLHGLLRRVAPSVAYALAIRLLGRHSHRAYLVRLRPA